jgi:riboflavin synthase
MFTGLIEEVGQVAAVERRAAGVRLRIACRKVLAGSRPGDSITVNGACLTAIELGSGAWAADVAPETLERTNLCDLAAGSEVNLERSLAAGARLGGHWVQGHVDATGELRSLEALGDGNWWLRVRVPPEVERYTVFKGSIAIDGISLTIAEVAGGLLGFTIIPHTYRETNLRSRRPGDRLNLEADILAKYVEKMLAGYTGARPAGEPAITMQKLRDLRY